MTLKLVSSNKVTSMGSDSMVKALICWATPMSLSRAAIWGALSGPVTVLVWVLLVLEIGLGEGEDGHIPWLGLARLTGVTTPAFAIAGCFSVWMAKQVAARPGTRAEVGKPAFPKK